MHTITPRNPPLTAQQQSSSYSFAGQPGAAVQSSIYTAPSYYDTPGSGSIRNKSETLFSDGYVTITRSAIWDLSKEPPRLRKATLNITTGNGADRVHVGTTPEGRLAVQINGNLYGLNSRGDDGKHLDLHLETRGADDHVTIATDVKNKVTVEGGDGNDTLVAGASRTNLLGGAGDDTLRLGSGGGYAEGDDGNDTIIGGSGDAILYGNNGDDRLYAGSGHAGKQSYLDGGSGNDALYAGSGHSVLNGGKGDDYLTGYDRTTFYSGKGRDQITNNRQGDLIYAKAGDSYEHYRNSTVTLVNPSSGGTRAFDVMGTPEFRQRVEDDFEFLRSSPLGQKTLAELDTLVPNTGGKITLQQKTFPGSQYLYRHPELNKARIEAQMTGRVISDDDPRGGKISNNKPGSLVDIAVVNYDQTGEDFSAPVIPLFHEFGHAFNGATGTFLPGTTREQSPSNPEQSEQISNIEFQAVGLPSSAPLFHFNGPFNSPTNINPEHFTENGLRRELGVPERKTYLT